METRPSGLKAAASKQDRREALVQAAFNRIAERGFEGLRTRDVAARVGVNIATLHYYFPTKEALIGGVVELAMARFRETLGGPGRARTLLRRAVKDGDITLAASPSSLAAIVVPTLKGLLMVPSDARDSHRTEQTIVQ